MYQNFTGLVHLILFTFDLYGCDMTFKPSALAKPCRVKEWVEEEYNKKKGGNKEDKQKKRYSTP